MSKLNIRVHFPTRHLGVKLRAFEIHFFFVYIYIFWCIRCVAFIRISNKLKSLIYFVYKYYSRLIFIVLGNKLSIMSNPVMSCHVMTFSPFFGPGVKCHILLFFSIFPEFQLNSFFFNFAILITRISLR